MHLSNRGGWQTIANGGTVTDSKKTERLIRVWDPQGERFETGRCHLAAERIEHPDPRDGNLAQVVGGQGALMRPEGIRGSMQTKDAAELQRR